MEKRSQDGCLSNFVQQCCTAHTWPLDTDLGWNTQHQFLKLETVSEPGKSQNLLYASISKFPLVFIILNYIKKTAWKLLYKGNYHNWNRIRKNNFQISCCLILTLILSKSPNKNYNSHTSGFQWSCNLWLKAWSLNHSFMSSSAFCLEYFTILLIQLFLMLLLLLRRSTVKPFYLSFH